mgnify:CR=1 FL=1
MEIEKNVPEKRRLFTRWFTRRITSYVVICLFLTVVNHMISPHYWWVAWVAAGWGLNLALSLIWYLTDCDDERNYLNH